VEVIPEVPEAVRNAAYWAFSAAREPLDGSSRSARARDRIRNIKSPRGIAGLPPELRALWAWHAANQSGFAALSFEEQKAEFMFIQADGAVTGLDIPAQVGRRGHHAFHAAGASLLEWWEGQGLAVTANLGPDRANPYPCDTVRFLATEFIRIAERYDGAPLRDFDAPNTEFDDPEASRLARQVHHSALTIGFDVAARHTQKRTTKR
jgi:hypothetical protein